MTQINNFGTDFLIIIPPEGQVNTVYPPYGAMYIASALRLGGYSPLILNVDVERINERDVIERVSRINPRYIGFSAIVATSYKYIKNLSIALRLKFPDKLQILGGGLSSAPGPIFKNTAVDIIVCGEGEETIVELFRVLENKGDLHNVRGMYLKEGDSYIFTGERALINPLDLLAYPAFDLIDMYKYLPDGVVFIKQFTPIISDKRILDKKRKPKMVTLPAGRGCFGECSFCYRAYPGIRMHSLKYFFDFIEYCSKQFNAGFFTFGDECFANNKARNWAFIEEYKKRNLDLIFRILGMRVDTVDKEILQEFKNIGCWMIEYGFESGSQKMLNIMNKKVTVKQNREVALWTNNAGIHTSPTLVLAMPGENNKTIEESIDFLKSLNFGFKQFQWSYALPIPGSHLYDFTKAVGLIEDEDAYLTSLADGNGAGVCRVNLTDEPDEVVAEWADKIRNELDAYYFSRRYHNGLVVKILIFFAKIKLYYSKGRLFNLIMAKLKSLLSWILIKKNHASKIEIIRSYGRRKDVKFEAFIEGLDHSLPNSQMALKRINERILN